MLTLKTKMRLYWPLIKSLQTGLLVSTGLAGYMSARCPIFHLATIVGLAVSLFASISGSTILNMWWDRDIDGKMRRTKSRPMASGLVKPGHGLLTGLALAALGIGLAFLMDTLYGVIILAGVIFDVIIYTMWLKRRTCWSIAWGGVAGGMPVLAGRALAMGELDSVGILLALGVLFWIPTHILTFSMRYFEDYQAAGIPTFASKYGFHHTRVMIAISSILAASAMGLAAWSIGLAWGFLRLLGVLSAGLLLLAVPTAFKPSERINFGLFKYASVYMLAAMLLVVLAGL